MNSEEVKFFKEKFLVGPLVLSCAYARVFCAFALVGPLVLSCAYARVFRAFALVGPSGLEPPTSCLSGTRSNLLSYDPMWLVWLS